MSLATYEEIAEVISEEYPDFTVIMPEGKEEPLVVNPPEEFHHQESPAEVWIDGRNLELLFEDELVEIERPVLTSDVVASALVGLLQGREDSYVYSDGQD